MRRHSLPNTSKASLPQRCHSGEAHGEHSATWSDMAGAGAPPRFAPLVRTFRLKADAELWARQREAEIDRGELPVDHRAFARSRFRASKRYRDTVTPRKRGAAQERYKLRILLAHAIAKLSLERLTPAEIAAYRDQRLSVVCGGTVRRELAVLQHCLEVARSEWGIKLPQIQCANSSYHPRAQAGSVGLHQRSSQHFWEAATKSRSSWLPALIRYGRGNRNAPG